MGENILEMKNLYKSFGGIPVLTDVYLALRKNSILGLVGENGAGKSTMMNILGGVVARTSGEMILEGEPYSPGNPKDAEKAGIAFIHQELNLFTNLTVAENLLLNNPNVAKHGFFSNKPVYEQAKTVLTQLNIEVDPGEKIENLSMGLRQMVEIAKATIQDVKIVIFDEPTTSLSNVEKERFFGMIEDLLHKGISIIYISHSLDDVMRICEDVAVLRDGHIIAQKPIDEVTKDDIVSMMVGRDIENLYPYLKRRLGGDLLDVNSLTRNGVFSDISISVREREIVGLFGLMGSGRSEFARAMFGLDPIDSGAIVFAGSRVRKAAPSYLIRQGMAFITENRREEGLLLDKPVKDNLILVTLRNMIKRFGAMDFKKAEADSDKQVHSLSIKTFNKSVQTARLLSGGNQQKVVIGKWLLSSPKMLVLDEPTRGVDVGAKYEIYSCINKLAEDGAGVLFISSEMEELMGICDRILVMTKGHISGELGREDFSQDRIIRYALGEVK